MTTVSVAVAKPIRIALVSDPHVTLSTDPEKALYEKHLEEVIPDVNAAKPDFVLIAGDLTDGGLRPQLETFKRHLREFKEPVFYVPGNHDVGDKHLPGKTGVTPARIAVFEQILGPSFFVKRRDGVRVIGIDSSVLGSGLPAEDEQWKMLEKELAKSAAQPTIVLMHYPPFLEDEHETGGGYWNVEPAPRERLMALLRQGGVHLVLCGHLHRPLRVQTGDIHIVATLPVSFGLPLHKQPEGWTMVTLQPEAGPILEEHTVEH